MTWRILSHDLLVYSPAEFGSMVLLPPTQVSLIPTPTTAQFVLRSLRCFILSTELHTNTYKGQRFVHHIGDDGGPLFLVASASK